MRDTNPPGEIQEFKQPQSEIKKQDHTDSHKINTLKIEFK